ncbi:MAG TPA: hypothetical protein VF041_01205 [Gemmatimonadaceae bacterium]
MRITPRLSVLVSGTYALLAVTTLSLAGCATAHPVEGAGGDVDLSSADAVIAKPRVGVGPIRSAELRTIGDRDAYTAIKLLRPQFLQYRGRTSFVLDSPTSPEVYIDGMYYGPMESLRSLPSKELAEIRLLSVGDAVIRYGTGHTAGVIDITSVH